MSNLSILTFFFIISVSSFVANGSLMGGRTKIADVKTNKEVQELGKYSVEEYNRLRRSTAGENDGALKFSQVIEAEKQVVSGMKYYLKIEALTKSGNPKIFEAVVVVKPWFRSKQLLNFAPSPTSSRVVV